MLRNKNKNQNTQQAKNKSQQSGQQYKRQNANQKSRSQTSQKIQQKQQIPYKTHPVQPKKVFSTIIQNQLQQQQSSLLQHNLRQLLNQSAERQQKYINFIKQQKQQIFTITQKYVQAMSRYEKQLKQFITKKQNDKNTRLYEKLHRITAKNPPNLYKKKQYTKDQQCQLNCYISFIYIIPLINDYLKQTFPSKLTLQLTQYYPQKQLKSYNICLNPQISQPQKIEMIKKGYSIEIYKQDLTHAQYNFILSHYHDKVDSNKILKYYKNNQLQFLLKDQQSQIILGYGKIDLQYFLLYNQQNQISQVQKIPILAIDSPDKIIAFIHINLRVLAIPKTNQQQHIHKISQPITINKQLKFQSDKESRLIQRINQYKNVHHNIIPSVNRESNDKNILMHQKRKQLEQIQSYKQAHKNQFMDKVFGEAIEQFHTNYIEIGQCKYVPFVYTNHTQRHQRVKIKLSYRLLTQTSNKSQLKPDMQATQSDSISVQIVDPITAVKLLQQQIITYPNKTQNCIVQYKLQNQYIFVLMGESIIIFVKTICHAPNVFKYQINFELLGDYGDLISSDMVILKICQPVPIHVFPLYTFPEEINQVKIQVPTYLPIRPNSNIVGKVKIANIIGCQQSLQFESLWSQNYTILDLRIKTLAKSSQNKKYRCFLFIYDVNYTLQLAAYQFIFQFIQKIQEKKIDVGRTEKFIFKLKLSPAQGLTTRTLMGLKTSDYLGSNCQTINSIQKSKQFLIQPNIQQLISINYNTFSQSPPSDKLIISCMSVLDKRSIKKYILIMNKNPTIYRHIYHISCSQDKNVLFDFELYCNNKQETTLMRIEQDTIVMFSNQVKKIKLIFNYWNCESNVIFSTRAEQRMVTLAVDDGKNCVLYRFQLKAEN